MNSSTNSHSYILQLAQKRQHAYIHTHLSELPIHDNACYRCHAVNWTTGVCMLEIHGLYNEFLYVSFE